ncbi:MAG: hypothetical protein ACYCZY_02570 [Lacisediminihabitans sp.]
MELLFIILGGALLGLGVSYTFPGRETHGALLLPAIGADAAAVGWAALTWAGWRFDGGWIWVVSLVVATVGVILSAVLIARHRVAADREMLHSLSRA